MSFVAVLLQQMSDQRENKELHRVGIIEGNHLTLF